MTIEAMNSVTEEKVVGVMTNLIITTPFRKCALRIRKERLIA